MIVVQLLGGLGNQLFQYAIGRALADRRAVTLKLDSSAFHDYRLRPFKLGYFQINASEVTSDELESLRLPRPNEGLTARLKRRLLGTRMPVIRERLFGFDPAVLEAPAECYLTGYWQSPKYFAGAEAAVRKEFVVRSALTGRNKDVAQEIAQSLSVSVHVRRGDYASNPVTREYHGLCDAGYYDRAQQRLVDLLGPVTFYVFSDDPAWVRENLRFVCEARIVDHNGPQQDYEDLRLMSLCRHHIIANSTFSWWGAWLSQSPDKKIIAPRSWFKGAQQSADDLLPPEWLRL